LEARVKERLTGAIILVALLVLLVPELLTGPESKQAAKPAGADGAQLRSYTIDLQDGATGQPPPPTTAPGTAVSDDPVGVATPEAQSASPPEAEVSPPVEEAARAQGKPMGSGADVSAAEAPEAEVAKPAVPAPSSADDRPRSAFGPNARPQPAKPTVGKTESAKPPPAPKPESSKPEAARVAATKPETAKASGSKGYAVQLGVFGSRDNAERLAKQVKGNGFPVLVNETSGKDGKKLYWVRVGPEPDQAAATALSGKLKAAGHKDARVVAYP
jgi:DedD protein